MPQAGTSSAGTLLTQGEALAGEAVIQAGAQTAIEGGRFLSALKNDAVSDVAAAGAFAIGNAFDGQPGSLGVPNASDPAYVLAHAALGCAAGAAEGTGCGGGAIGAATSALVSPFLADQAGGAQNLTDGQRAAIAGTATLLGGLAAELAGQNAQGRAISASNEAENNSLSNHLAALLICVACNYGHPSSDVDTINDPTGEMTSVEDVEQIDNGNEFDPAPSPLFGQNPPK